MNDGKSRLAAVNGRLLELYKADRDTMTAFKALSDGAVKDGLMTTATKELVATAIAVSTGCDDCILYHVNEAKRHGASRRELLEILAIAIEMSGGPGTVYSAKALEAYDSIGE